jgi:hypothetical protein
MKKINIQKLVLWLIVIATAVAQAVEYIMLNAPK